MTTVLGVEEAGRGPVIGPMVMAAVLINEEDEYKLKELGVKDSKQLSPKRREELFEKIIKIVKDYKITTVLPQEIDKAVESDKKDMNLNWIEARKSADFINLLKPDKVILDCPSNNINAYASFIRRLLNIECEIIAEHKADENYPVVAAASILAKVTRDKEISDIKLMIGFDFGSGYPSDPVTKRFLAENYHKHSEIFRKSWSSYKNVARKKDQKKLNDF